MKKKNTKEIVVLTTWDSRLEKVRVRIDKLQATASSNFEKYQTLATDAEAKAALLESRLLYFPYAYVGLIDAMNYLNRAVNPADIKVGLDAVLVQRNDITADSTSILALSNQVRAAVKKSETAATTWGVSANTHDVARAAYMAARSLADNAAKDALIKAQTPAAVTKAEKAVGL